VIWRRFNFKLERIPQATQALRKKIKCQRFSKSGIWTSVSELLKLWNVFSWSRSKLAWQM